MLTSAPPPLRRRTGENACAMRRGPKKFVSISARAASVACTASEVELRPIPALLTRIDTSPQLRAAARTSSALFTSSRSGMTCGFVMVVRSRAAA